MAASPLILTLKLDAPAFAVLDALRRAHFPAERNFIPAHLTLFHALPGEHEPAIRRALQLACAATPAPALRFERPVFLGRGVALLAESPELAVLRDRLAAGWAPWLSAQDRQRFRPHVTIQNKVAPEQARQLHTALAAGWAALPARGEGLLLWRYLGGPWEPVAEERFASASQA
ncbi:2'-5' RNA ligase family protein [Kouleothrix sp.]|uniref:2'-5' RNA ligase family protein n=1 Tax=Kouleothrix sp. TaxID=2779161 RepID=UPI00391CC66A